jgi:hypothetical protein
MQDMHHARAGPPGRSPRQIWRARSPAAQDLRIVEARTQLDPEERVARSPGSAGRATYGVAAIGFVNRSSMRVTEAGAAEQGSGSTPMTVCTVLRNELVS